jgi:ribosomal protein S18 acetylase RimI-like enzyme
MNIQTDLELWRRPPAAIIEEIVQLASLLTGKWFTPNVPDDTRRDLLFHDAFCLRKDGALAAFLVFTSLDGSIQITLIGVHPAYHRQGYGSCILDAFFQHVKSLGFERVIAFTVPPEVNPAYRATLGFYQKHGFTINRYYRELWENGALELVKILEP